MKCKKEGIDRGGKEAGKTRMQETGKKGGNKESKDARRKNKGKSKEERSCSLQMKQVLWKLLPLHWISSAWYTVFSQAAHLAPPPQFGILEK